MIPLAPPYAALLGRFPLGWLLRVVVVLVFMSAVLVGLSWAQWGNVSPIWPASGIGIAAMFYLGPAIWPAIFLGALGGGLLMSMGLVESVASACGGVAEALLTWHIYRRFSAGLPPLANVSATLHFLAAVVSGTLASALIGAITLALLGVVPWSIFVQVGLAWWLANIAGAILVGSALLSWWRGAGAGEWRGGSLEFAGVLLAMALAAYLSFGPTEPGEAVYPLEFLPMPALFWAALRFGLRGVSMVMLLLGAYAVWATIGGHGVFAQWSGMAGYWLLLSYVLVGGAPMLAIAAIAREREAQRMALIRARDLLGKEVLASGRERDCARESLRESLARLDVVVSEVPLALWAVNAYGRVTLARGLGLADAERRLVREGPLPAEELFAGAPEFLAHVRRVQAGEPVLGEVGLHGHRLEAHGKPQFDAAGQFTGALGVAFDVSHVTSRHQAQMSLAHRQDGLTGLASRHEFIRKLDAAMTRAREDHQRLILMRLDFVGLDHINARYGYDMGDEVLAELAGRLREQCSRGAMLARLAGDAISVLIVGRNTREQAGRLAESLIAVCAPPYQRVLPDTLHTHIGIALFPDHCDTSEALMAQAESALKAAKSLGPNTFAFHVEAEAP